MGLWLRQTEHNRSHLWHRNSVKVVQFLVATKRISSIEIGAELMCPVRLSCSCFTSDPRHATPVTNRVERMGLRQTECMYIRSHLWHIYSLTVTEVYVATRKNQISNIEWFILRLSMIYLMTFKLLYGSGTGCLTFKTFIIVTLINQMLFSLTLNRIVSKFLGFRSGI